MSDRSRKKSSKNIQRPILPSLLRRAEEIASHYQVVLKHEDGEYYGRGLELPLAMGEGKTPDDCVKNTRQAMALCIAVMLEDHEVPPRPASDKRRTEQINIRLTPEEKLFMEEVSRARGFRGISDYVRSLIISSAG